MNSADFALWFREVDWTAVGTWMLVVVGAFAARYAWKAARAANETLRLEVEPILAIAALGPNTWLRNNESWSFTNRENTLVRTAAGGAMTADGGIQITNVGRGVAVNLSIDIAIEPTVGSGVWISFPLRITKLSTNESYILDVERLDGGFPFRIFVRGATRSSFSLRGKTEGVTLVNSPGFPITI